mgnify:FL=1
MIFHELKLKYNCIYDEKDSIGKRYRRNDAIGTPFCVTLDYDTINDLDVTIRDRDSMIQKRVPIGQLSLYIESEIGRNVTT